MAFTNTPDNSGFTGVGQQDIDTSSLASVASSFASEFSQTTGTHFTRTSSGASQTAASDSDNSSAGTPAPSASQTASTTFATSIATPGSPSESPNSSAGSQSTSASNAASSTTGGAVTVSEKSSSCNSISCSPALKAAIAVPIVVAAIAAILLFFFCARRRKRRAGAAMSEKAPKKQGKKWTRHLRAFSFDAELLMGGRFSSSNSIRSRDPSVRSGPGTLSRASGHSGEPSLHSIDEVAPPYRDAVTNVTPPSPTRAIPHVTTIAADPIPRPSSTATAPPPYRSIVGGTGAEPPSPSTIRNPFADSTPVSPIEGSPFNDPPEEASGALRPTLSRGSSMYRSVMTEDDPTPTASEAGSIRQAMVGRRVSVRNGDGASGGGGGNSS
ncbi:hypothetical protein Z517_00257 [Fonsecaea pedrosoi CBS 271.37]|uniref:Uncharacterized protein n=1 Tax=Fonsecaea pedrosoi CBS 271.37 TaxID=1442368 RepID=A0A0D2HK41_9EURO|nr:uncharacterized protein Z517_00257 [Fonsecaea pedrosoi CBS 271.37]KIW84869.1 hypothetical protein Z517_00257 [Fonsecaea pedrosoi CBS 271.37]